MLGSYPGSRLGGTEVVAAPARALANLAVTQGVDRKDSSLLCLLALGCFSHQEVGCVRRVSNPRGLPGTEGAGDADFQC